ncbi:helicase-related protein [Methyloligella solikamskensis]|uniref:Helicase-related protein n=1 Tax=Methyloligella solikamskensis TaxID=1177756 RepID=A0ABW3J8S6_9HYPH
MSSPSAPRSGGPVSRGAQLRGRGVTAVLGPTNTGKTHLAIERMLAHDVGIIGLPLRLLAREVYDKVVARIGASQVALITGEEKIKPANARYYICTVEAMPMDIEADFVAIDEIQLAADDERGHVFTDRLFNARGLNETLLLGAATMREAIHDLLPGANLVSRPRLSKLTYAADKKITRLPRRTAIVAFSANEVYAIAELVRRQRGGAAVVLGALSPRTRNAQVALYQNGDVDFLVATDAIGMGLNLNVDHVAFAGIRKFDGRVHRNLSASELGQIAGRAGRYMNDGTFGVTGKVPPFDPELVTQLEDHHFDPVTTLQWRNRKLDYGSIDRLKESLKVTPDNRRLMRARMVDDVIALENVSSDDKIREMAKAPAAIGLLWEMCQIPDYRKISATSHAELIATLYGFVMSDSGRIPADWFRQQIERCERTDGDIDTLSARLAQIRTWTFVSHRGQWLEDPEYWQGRSREIEDTLSDALHERLALRFVDRRTSVLMRRLRDKEEFVAEVGSDGKILVENHYVGQLQGFLFTADAGGEGIHGKAARHAASKVVSQELTDRAQALSDAPDSEIALTPHGRVVWKGAEIARLERGETALKPRIQIIAGEHLTPPDRERIENRLETWLDHHLEARIGPLLALAKAEHLTGLARGFAFRLTENLGVLRRDALAEEIRALDQPTRRQLRQHGLRFGGFNVYVPALLKPDAAELLLLLWVLHDGEAHGITPDSMPERPSQGLTSVPVDKSVPVAFWHAAGFHVAGARAVRIDMLERLSDLIRQRVSWRPPSAQAPTEPVKAEAAKAEETAQPETEAKAEAKPADATQTEPTTEAKPETAAAAETPESETAPATAEASDQAAKTEEKKSEEKPSRMRSDALAKRAGTKKKKQPSNEPPSGATGDGGFRVVPELMSVVGCSGEDFTSILKALGFRCQRIPLPPETQEAKTETATETAAPATAEAEEPAADGAETEAKSEPQKGANEPKEASEPEERFDEIWRPSRRAQGRPQERNARRGRGAPKQEGQRKRSRPPQNRGGKPNNKPNNRPPRERREKAPDPAHSPFAALEELKRNMMARGTEGN